MCVYVYIHIGAGVQRTKKKASGTLEPVIGSCLHLTWVKTKIRSLRTEASALNC